MNEHTHHIAIIGAGPAGLSAATRAAEAGLSHILLEAEAHLSNTIHRFQKGKHVMAEPNRLPLRSSLAFMAGTRESILEDWAREAARLQVNVRHHAPVTRIGGRRGDFTLTLADGGTVRAEAVILAIGLQGQANKLGVQGEDLGHVDYQLDDQDDFIDTTIVVVGAGDSAIENALALAECNRVIVINRRDGFDRAAAANRSAILGAIDDGRIECHYHSSPEAIEESGGRALLRLRKEPGQPFEILCDKIIARLGAKHPRAFLESCGVEFSSSDPAALPTLDRYYQSTVNGLFVIGALAGAPLIKQALNQGYEVVEFIRGAPVQPVEDALLLDKFEDVATINSVDSALRLVRDAIPLLADVSERQLRELLAESSFLRPESNATIYQCDDYSDAFYAILAGSVRVQLNTDDIPMEVRLTRGDFFGDTELISGRRRAVSVVADPACVLIEMPRLAVGKLAASAETVASHLETVAVERALHWYLAPALPREVLQPLVESAVCRRLEAGEMLYRSGEQGDNLHFIRSGSVTVARQDDDREHPYRMVTAGDYVGEWAVLTNSQRKATVRATAVTEIVEIQGAAFKTLLRDHPDLRRNVHAKAFTRLQVKPNAKAGGIISFLMEQGLGEATDVLLIDESLCVRCDNCEKACADTHQGVSRLNREAGPTFASIHVPTSCRHCVEPHCMKDCPPNAIHRAGNGEVFIDETCIGCGNCVNYCPYGVIHLKAESEEKKPNLLNWLLFGKTAQTEAGTSCGGAKKAVKCDMCKDLSGGPACVSACPTGAAFRISPEQLLPDVVKLANKR